MAQFDVHHNPAGGMVDGAPFVADIQADQLSGLPTRMIVPLARPDGFQPIRHLNPLVEVDGERFAVMVHLMAAVPRQVLGPPVANLEHHRADLIAALDFLFTGI